MSLTIGGVTAQVAFAGLAPGTVAIYQIVTTVPDGVPPGESVPIVITVANQVGTLVVASSR